MLKRPSTRPVRNNRLGFTLLELLIVVAIIMLIAAMVVPNLIGNQQAANEGITRATVDRMNGTVGAYAACTKPYPPTGASCTIPCVFARESQPLHFGEQLIQPLPHADFDPVHGIMRGANRFLEHERAKFSGRQVGGR